MRHFTLKTAYFLPPNSDELAILAVKSKKRCRIPSCSLLFTQSDGKNRICSYFEDQNYGQVLLELPGVTVKGTWSIILWRKEEQAEGHTCPFGLLFAPRRWVEGLSRVGTAELRRTGAPFTAPEHSGTYARSSAKGANKHGSSQGRSDAPLPGRRSPRRCGAPR